MLTLTALSGFAVAAAEADVTPDPFAWTPLTDAGFVASALTPPVTISVGRGRASPSAVTSMSGVLPGGHFTARACLPLAKVTENGTSAAADAEGDKPNSRRRNCMNTSTHLCAAVYHGYDSGTFQEV